MAEVHCVLCSLNLTTSRTRRKLTTPSSQHITNVTAEVLGQVIPVDKRVNTAMLQECYTCRICFSSMEKILKLRENSLKSFEDACNKARGAVRLVPLVEIVEGRPPDEDMLAGIAEDEDQPPPAKRKRLLAPATLPVTSEGKSPLVSVRLII